MSSFLFLLLLLLSSRKIEDRNHFKSVHTIGKMYNEMSLKCLRVYIAFYSGRFVNFIVNIVTLILSSYMTKMRTVQNELKRMVKRKCRMKRRPKANYSTIDAIYGEIEIILPRKYVLQISCLVYHVKRVIFLVFFVVVVVVF